MMMMIMIMAVIIMMMKMMLMMMTIMIIMIYPCYVIENHTEAGKVHVKLKRKWLVVYDSHHLKFHQRQDVLIK